MLHNSKVARILQHREEKNKRAMQMELDNFRQQHQLPRSQEFDLDDVDYSGVTGEMLPVILRYHGEDLDIEERLQEQKKDFKEWNNLQKSQQAAERHQQTLESKLVWSHRGYTP